MLEKDDQRCENKNNSNHKTQNIDGYSGYIFWSIFHAIIGPNNDIYVFPDINKLGQTSNIRRNWILDHSDVVGASPVGAAPITSSFSTEHQASMDWVEIIEWRYEKPLSYGIWGALY